MSTYISLVLSWNCMLLRAVDTSIQRTRTQLYCLVGYILQIGTEKMLHIPNRLYESKLNITFIYMYLMYFAFGYVCALKGRIDKPISTWTNTSAAPLTNMEWLVSQHGLVITCAVKCKTKKLHPQPNFNEKLEWISTFIRTLYWM